MTYVIIEELFNFNFDCMAMIGKKICFRLMACLLVCLFGWNGVVAQNKKVQQMYCRICVMMNEPMALAIEENGGVVAKAIDDTDINQVWAFPAIVGPYFVLYNATGNKALCFENSSVKLADVASRKRKDFLWTRKDRQFRAMQDPSYVMAITPQGRLTAVQQSASTDVLTEFLIDPLSPDLIEPLIPKSETEALVGKTKDVKSQERVTKSSMAIASRDYAGAVYIDELKVDQRAGGTPVRRLEEEVVDNSIVEVPASYPGGDAAVLKFVSENLIYPIEARNAGLQGTVVLRFIIEKDGSIGQIVVRKSLSKECDQAAAQVVSKLKRFTPAEQQGHKMKVWYTLPIRFSIQ